MFERAAYDAIRDNREADLEPEFGNMRAERSIGLLSLLQYKVKNVLVDLYLYFRFVLVCLLVAEIGLYN